MTKFLNLHSASTCYFIPDGTIFQKKLDRTLEVVKHSEITIFFRVGLL